MKTAGIVLVVLGSLSLLGFLLNPTGGASAGGLVFIVLGAYLIYRAKQKKERAARQTGLVKRWNRQ